MLGRQSNPFPKFWLVVHLQSSTMRAGRSTFSFLYTLRPVGLLQMVWVVELAGRKAQNQGSLPGTNKRRGGRLGTQ